MPRARPAYLDPQIKITPARFDQATRARLKTICPDHAFTRRLAVLAGYYRDARKVGAPSDAALLATLADLDRWANGLHDRLGKLPPRLFQSLDLLDVRAGLDSRSREVLVRALERFRSFIPYARRGLRARPGPRNIALERRAAQWVRDLFSVHAVPLRLVDDRRGKRDAAAFCIRLVLGLSDSARVEHYLRAK